MGVNNRWFTKIKATPGKTICLSLLSLGLLTGGWWTYRLIWGKPLNINHFYERAMIDFVRNDPELLTSLGLIDGTLIDFHSDDLSDVSPSHTEKMAEKIRQNLVMLRRYDFASQSDSQRLSTEILEWFLNNEERGRPFLYHHYPVNQLFGVQSETPDLLINQHSVTNKKSAQRYVARLSKFDDKFAGLIESLQLSEARGVIPPRFVLEKVLDQMRDFKAVPVEEHVLYTSFIEKLNKVEKLDETSRAQLAAQAQSEIERTIYPTYDNLIEYLEGLALKSNTDDGVWKLPDGDAYYAYQLRSHTTTDDTPEQVHEMGLAEVARIQIEMRTILDDLGYTGKTVAEHMRQLGRDPQFLYPDTEAGRSQILSDYQTIVDEINQGLSEVFNLRPEAGVKVERIPEFKEETAPIAYYQRPAMDGSRPGIFFANLRDTKAHPKFRMRTLAYHEAIPGHHFQVGLQQDIQDVPTFRKVIPFTAYAEGWALYTEQLAWEMGFQADPYSNLGRLQDELLRAVRLVVDTGIHAKRWTREEAIDYMMTSLGMLKDNVVTEVERYIVMPGQACAYKIGMMKLLELRERAQQGLGDRFDLRAFHDVVLQNGAMPLTILEREVDVWIEQNVPAYVDPPF
ncbi:MAG: DUF885 domain-containing protein [Leptolyngbyaceae cyanobacterium MO_188.B28]|nr:DUF885 domain-containing protein [Leptolyngbyaceae cyanobacterium MO_188.B28]